MTCSVSPSVRSAEDIGLCALSQAGFGELFDRIVNTMLVNGKVNGSKGAPSYFLLDYVLIDPMYCTALILAVGIFRARM